MKKEDVLNLATALGAEQLSTGDQWVRFKCLLAPWTHQNKTDSNPSGGIKIGDSGPSHYYCFSCGHPMPLDEFLLDLHRRNKMRPSGRVYDFKNALNIVRGREISQDDELEAALKGQSYDERRNNPINVAKFYPFSEEWLASFPSAIGHPYAYERGLDDAIINHYEVKIDPYQNRICFPFREAGGQLAGFHGRAMDNATKLRYYAYDYEGHRNNHVWMHEHHVTLDQPLVLTEGMFDLSQITKVYGNVLASRTSAFSQAMADRVRGASNIITAYDLGTGGDKGRARAEKFFQGANLIHMMPPEQFGDFGATPKAWIRELFNQFMVLDT